MKKYTIFINERPIYLTDDLEMRSRANFFEMDKVEIFPLIIKLEHGEITDLFLYHPSLRKAWKIFKKHFKIIKAAGGIVKNLKGDILFIYRNDKWDLPKGKLEKGEKIESAAVREVEEECGINDLELRECLLKTYHIYKLKKKYILKTTTWFLMISDFREAFTPQFEEGITRVEWVPKEKLTNVSANTYANIKLCLNKVTSILPE